MAGVLLLAGCGTWLLVPVVSDAARVSTTGTIESYDASLPLTGTGIGTVQYRPTIRYTVDHREHRFTAKQSVTSGDEERLPPGSHTTVRYLANDPSDAVWAPGGDVVAVNFWGTTGAVLGALLVVAAIVMWRLDRIRRARMSTKESE